MSATKTIDLRAALVLAVVVMVASVGIAVPLSVTLAQDGQAGAPPAQRAALGTAFTYQGRLDSAGTPANGTYDLSFALFEADAGGAGLASVEKLGTTVTGGLFSVLLDFGISPFETGQARWIEVSVKQGAEPYATLAPRHPLTAAPYALHALTVGPHDHAGESWVGPSTYGLQTSGQQTGLVGIQGNPSGWGYPLAGVFGVSSSGTGVQGQSTTGNGLEAVTQGRGRFGAGTYSVSIADGCTTPDVSESCPIGVFGGGYGDDGVGVLGQGYKTGILGESLTANAVGVTGDGGSLGNGVVGRSTASGYAATYGENPNGTGVYGVGPFGVIGHSASATGAGVDGRNSAGNGVFGQSNTVGYAGVHGQSAVWNGVYGEGIGSATGVAASSGTGSGVYATGFYGVRGIGSAGGAGIRGEGFIAGEFHGRVIPGSNNAYTLGLPSHRWNTVYSVNNLDVSSDLRLKTAVDDLRYGLDDVLKLRPVSFEWSDDPEAATHLGLIAQEAREVIPSLVHGDEATEYLSITSAELIPVLIRAIQEQHAQIEALKVGQGPVAPQAASVLPTGTAGPASTAFSEGTLIVFAGIVLPALILWRRRAARNS